MSWIRPVAVVAALTAGACAPAMVFPSATLAQVTPNVPQTPLASYLDRAQLREIGPAIMGGRISDLAVDESNPSTFYVGFATGGLWKTTSGGMDWEPIFDDQRTSSIGDVTLAPSNPNVVYVGTGEPQNRQSSPWGAGVFRSMDGGRTWQDLGLVETRHISRIVVHPMNPDVAYVAAVGRLWGPNEERGVYKTTDGGATWDRVLYLDEHTGAIDLAMDPGDPNTLFAAMYQRRRTAFGFSASGGGGGIYRTFDGGANWDRLEGEGLPEGEIGRVGLDIFRRDGNLVYATIESENREETGTYRSTDRGESWEMMSNRNPRPMYFSLVRIDPNNADRIYLGGVRLSISDDGGRTWWEGDAAEGIHVDHHALWVDPNDSEHVILGSDGGLSTTENGGRNWRMIANMAVGQFYEIGHDMQDPYWVCGGLQDNSSWCAPNQSLDSYGIMNGDWVDVSGGDGFYNQIDPTDHNIIYTESQGGNLMRRNMATGEAQRIRPIARPIEEDPAAEPEPGAPAEDDDEDEDRSYQFNWDAPIEISHHDVATILFGANHLMRSPDRGVSWEEISPDLTRRIDRDTLTIMGKALSEPHLSRNDGINNYGNISSISESHFTPDVIFVGTDDGNLQVTRDGGVTWTNVIANVPDLPDRTYVSRIDASHHAEGRVYVSFDGHHNDDFAAHVYVSEDYGATFTKIVNGLPSWSVNAVREHPQTPNLLFVGNEIGAYVSVDRGATWNRLRGNFPTVPVDDIAIHPRDDDLILGTHGRSIWILHDLAPLRALAGGDTNSVVTSAVYEGRRGTLWARSGGWPFWGDQFAAENPADGVSIKFFIGQDVADAMMVENEAEAEGDGGEEAEEGGMMGGGMGMEGGMDMDSPAHAIMHNRMHGPSLRILDSAGEVVRTLDIEEGQGYQEVIWDFRIEPTVEPPQGGRGGFFGASRAPHVLPGTYTARLMAAGVEYDTRIEVRLDPRITVSQSDLMARQEALIAVHQMVKPVRDGRDALRRLNEQLGQIKDLLSEASDVPEELETKVEEISTLLEEIGDDMGDLNRVTRLGGAISGSTTRPSADQLYQIDQGWEDMVDVLERLNVLITDEMPDLNQRLNEMGLRPDPGEAIVVPRRSGG